MNIKPPDPYQLAVAILAIATAAIGFGLFGNNFQIGELAPAPGQPRAFQVVKLAGLVSTTLFYFLVLVTVSRMLSKDKIANQELVNGPMVWFYLEMVSLTVLYFFGIIEELTGD